MLDYFNIADHAFENGNKRTAFDKINMFLRDFGVTSPLTTTQLWDLVAKMAEGGMTDVAEISRILGNGRP